jgi:4-amino-4-deoxy-L-arabinose transferase-like glycosyltransferase
MHHLRKAFAAVALALLVAPLVANAPLFDPDEGLHAAIAQEMVRSGDYVTPTFLGQPFLDKPILFFWTEALSLRLFGDTEFAIRVPPLLFGLAGMLAIALLGRSLFGDAAGLTAGIAYATMLLPFGVSQVAVHDIGLIGFMTLACWCLVEASVSSRRTALLIVTAGVALGLSILTKGLVGCVFATIFAACLAIRAPAALPRLAVVLVGAGVVAILVAAPWYVAMEQAHPGYLHYYFVERHLQGYLTATQRHAGRPWWYYVPIVAGGALPWTGYLLLALRDARADALRLVLWGWFAIGLVFLSIGESKLVTYALPLFPALALLAGETIARRSAPAVEGRLGFRVAVVSHATLLAFVPAAGLIVLQLKFGESHPYAWAFIGVAWLVTVFATRRAVRSRETNGVASWMSVAALASVAAVMIVLPRIGSWMSARDLAQALNDGGRLPSRVSVLDERIGSLVFYLSPALRAQATADRLNEASYSEAVLRVRVDPEDAVLAVRNDQLERFSRLFSHPPVPESRAGTFTVFRAGRLREALGIE